jgi:hypothetical protein
MIHRPIFRRHGSGVISYFDLRATVEAPRRP